MLKTDNPLPTSPRNLVNRTPFFYGWIIMVAGVLASIMSSPGQTYAISIFIEYFIEDLGINRSVVSTLYTVGTLIASFTLPFIGRQIDQRGSRYMVTIISLLFGVACLYMGFIQNALMLGIGFMCVRMLGQGGLSLVSSNVINQWWVRRRGTVMGIAGVLSSLVALGGFPNFLNWLIPIYGWRVTYIFLGVLLFIVMAPIGYFFFRDRPEQYGLRPDGDPPITVTSETVADNSSQSEASQSVVDVQEENWTLSEALRTPAYWLLTSGLAVYASLATGLTFHIVSIFEDSGLSSDLAAAAFVPMAVTTAITTFGSGILADYGRVRVLGAIAMFLLALVLWMAQYLSSALLATLFGVLFGITSGLMRTVLTVAWARWYGRLHLGAITGTTATIGSASSALGPMPLGIARDMLGSYNDVLNIALVLPIIIGIAMLFVQRPTKSSHANEADLSTKIKN